MKRFLLILATGALMCTMFTSTSGVAKAGVAEPAVQKCEDFLARMHKKPAHIVYHGCRFFPEQQGKPLRATYRVAGRFAAATEATLVRTVGLNGLKRSCCQWDSPARQFKDARGQEFSITMVSGETPVTTRSAWRRIPMFEITVETFTEEI